MSVKKIVVLSGAGMSQESGIPTYRDMGGLWQKYDFMELASPEGWKKNPELVLDFYNERRKHLLSCEPNPGHLLLAELQHEFNVHIVTQNVDDLHERAGSNKVLHLHGELRKAESTADPSYVVNIEGAYLYMGDTCPLGAQLRPNVVWFGEMVTAINEAVKIVSSADILLVIGTSLNVYPAASLIHYVPQNCKKFLIDPNMDSKSILGFEIIREKAGKGLEIFIQKLKAI
jgi:NAD-dependent deacetylase